MLFHYKILLFVLGTLTIGKAHANGDSTEPVRHALFNRAHYPALAASATKRSANKERYVHNTQNALGVSRQGRPILTYFFQGKTDRKALVIGGVHGTELSGVEVAYELIRSLQGGTDTPLYSVLIIPELFPDNTALARSFATSIGSPENIGRYSSPVAIDPNRQMPPLGKPFRDELPCDALGREIEAENQMLLRVISEFVPERIVNLHAIRDVTYSGVFADPRTDENLIAHGFSPDSLLAVNMAKHIAAIGTLLPGNRLDSKPNALYLHDPAISPAGHFQKRNVSGSCLNAGRGKGVSLGGWASTAVKDCEHPELDRPALTIITMEFPGCKRPQDYVDPTQIAAARTMVNAFASAIANVFLN